MQTFLPVPYITRVGGLFSKKVENDILENEENSHCHGVWKLAIYLRFLFDFYVMWHRNYLPKRLWTMRLACITFMKNDLRFLVNFYLALIIFNQNDSQILSFSIYWKWSEMMWQNGAKHSISCQMLPSNRQFSANQVFARTSNSSKVIAFVFWHYGGPFLSVSFLNKFMSLICFYFPFHKFFSVVRVVRFAFLDILAPHFVNISQPSVKGIAHHIL